MSNTLATASLHVDGGRKMDLQKTVTVLPNDKPLSCAGMPNIERMTLTLFESVRRWTNDEKNPFDIEVDGRRLTTEDIEKIAHSEAYKAELLAFDERR